MATFMREVLTNPIHGYYMQKDVFGKKGDFVTSPEISPLFGEMVAVWCLNEWLRMGKPAFNLVELGPGRGTLQADIIRTLRHRRDFLSCLQVHLMEASPAMRDIQAKTLGCQLEDKRPSVHFEGQTFYGTEGVSIKWFPIFSELPSNRPTIFVAQEFFDALPAHQFVFTKKGWCEKMVDLNRNPESHSPFEFVLSNSPTLTSKMLIPPECNPLKQDNSASYVGDSVEISVESASIAQKMGAVVKSHGGAGIVVDYGQDMPVGNSLRAIREHKFEGVFENVGKADLSVNVDFSRLRSSIAETNPKVKVEKLRTQKEFLEAMGIDARLTALLRDCDDEEEAGTLIEGFDRLVNEKQMGSVYKVLTFYN